MTKVVSALKARKNFGEILNEVYYKGDEVIVERKGKEMVKISPLRRPVKKFDRDKFLSFAGVLSGKDTSGMKKVIIETRHNSPRQTSEI